MSQLPGTSELFRPTGAAAEALVQQPAQPAGRPGGTQPSQAAPRPVASADGDSRVRPSGRRKHDEKITVYISAAELVALEQTRLQLRVEHGLGCDRGRIVREAIAELLADYEERGAASTLVRRLTEG